MVSEGTAGKLPKLDSLKRTIQRQRVQVLAASAQPATLEQLPLPPEYKKTAKGELVPLVRLWPGGTANPHFRDKAKPGDVAVIPGLVG